MKWPLIWLAMQLSVPGNALLINEPPCPPAPPVLRSPGGHLEALVFSADGKWFAAAYFDLHRETRHVGVWDTNSLRPIFMDHEKAGCKSYEALTFSPDNKQLLALGDSQDRNELIVWDTASGKRIKEQSRPRQRHDPHLLALGQTRELLRAVDGRWLLHDTKAGLVTAVATAEVVHDYDKKYPDRELGVSGHGGIIVPGNKDVPRFVYDAITGKLINTHPPIKGGIFFDFSRDGMTRSAFVKNGFLITKGDPPRKRVINFDVKSKSPDGITLSPDGRWMAISYQYRREKEPAPALFPGEYEYQQIFDTSTGRAVGDAIGGMGVYFSLQGDRMAVVSKDDFIGIIGVPLQCRERE